MPVSEISLEDDDVIVVHRTYHGALPLAKMLMGALFWVLIICDFFVGYSCLLGRVLSFSSFLFLFCFIWLLLA